MRKSRSNFGKFSTVKHDSPIKFEQKKISYPTHNESDKSSGNENGETHHFPFEEGFSDVSDLVKSKLGDSILRKKSLRMISSQNKDIPEYSNRSKITKRLTVHLDKNLANKMHSKLNYQMSKSLHAESHTLQGHHPLINKPNQDYALIRDLELPNFWRSCCYIVADGHGKKLAHTRQ